MGDSMEDQADKFRQQKKYNQLLLIGAARGYAKDVEALVELGAALDFKDKKGLTALHYAAGNGRLAPLKFLWSRGAEVDAEAPDGCTPLHLAAAKGHAEAATFLIQKGAWVGAEDAQDNTPLHLAASRGHEGVMEVLLQQGAKVGAVNRQGLTPQGYALVKGHVGAAKRLLGWGGQGQAAAGDERPGGLSLLHLVAANGQAEAARLLVERGADVNESNNPERLTPLHSAVLSGEAACVEALLGLGADPTAADAAGRLPGELLPEAISPKQAAQIRELLGAAAKKRGGGGRAVHGGVKPEAAAAAAAAAVPKSPHEIFQGLPDKERRSKVELWATMAGADLEAALAGYPADVAGEVSARVAQLQALRARINVHKAMAAAHCDEEFQSDAAQPHVRAAVEALRQDPTKYDQYAADPVILSVLGKLRRLHAVCQANGLRTLNLDEVLAKPGVDTQEQDAKHGAMLNAEHEAHLAGAAAAAGAPSGGGQAATAAAAAYAASLEGSKQQQREEAEAWQQQRQAASQQGPAAGEGSLLQKLGASSKEGGAAAAAAAAASARGGRSGVRGEGGEEQAAAAIREMEGRSREEGGEDEDEEKLPEWLKGGFSWKKVWEEFWRQTKVALLTLAVFLIASWVMRGRPPWEGAQRAQRGSGAPPAGGDLGLDGHEPPLVLGGEDGGDGGGVHVDL